MELGRYLVKRHLREHTPVAELAAAHGVDRSWVYKLLARHRAEGEAGLEPRFRRPQRSPTRIRDRFDDEIVGLRKQLSEASFDAGAQTIHAHLARRHDPPPSISTICRVLNARGFVTTHHTSGSAAHMSASSPSFPTSAGRSISPTSSSPGLGAVEVLPVIDDHSRLCVAAKAFQVVNAHDVVNTFCDGAATWGYPASVLSDNGAIFTAA